MPWNYLYKYFSFVHKMSCAATDLTDWKKEICLYRYFLHIQTFELIWSKRFYTFTHLYVQIQNVLYALYSCSLFMIMFCLVTHVFVPCFLFYFEVIYLCCSCLALFPVSPVFVMFYCVHFITLPSLFLYVHKSACSCRLVNSVECFPPGFGLFILSWLKFHH